MDQAEDIILKHPTVFLLWSILIPFVGFLAGWLIKKILFTRKIGDARKKADGLITDARKEAEIIKKQAEIEVKDIILKTKSDLEKESNQRRIELTAIEKRLLSKEELLEKKYSSLDKRENDYRSKEAKLDLSQKELDYLKNDVKKQMEQQKIQLLSVARLSEDEAKKQVFRVLEQELESERASFVRKYEAETKQISDKKARNIIVLSIQRQALEQVQDHSTKTVPIPNDEMKGRIIGRDGRNIRAFEQACGVDLIVDDTPDSILISCFDPVRRHIAKIALEKLLTDGRIHPVRIEELVEKARKETAASIKEAGETAIAEAGLSSFSPELIKLLGQLQFRTSYGQPQLKHSIEVAHLSGTMAAELGADIKLAKRAGILHDIGKAVTHEIEGSHAMIGADLCKKYGESPDVEHAIRAHHHDVEPRTVYAYLVDAADAISGGRPGARSKTEAMYIQRLEQLEEICLSFKGVQRSYAIQAGRDVRVLVDPHKISDEQAVLMARDITKRIEQEMQFPGQIKVSVIRELRAVEYAQ
ncbi:MAG: ribonuclease Y [Candidatus Aureabacteria bacterium]|nr:ribonuclease Y [Candidatus Auribacterota bacterium]